jgi:hypothetical protein
MLALFSLESLGGSDQGAPYCGLIREVLWNDIRGPRAWVSLPMDRVVLEDILAAAERHVAEAECQLANQRERVAQR